mmetsp:Transcript_33430/g.45212  ORF Transcript_33430/g.45212 Transcript_33430/m.45212 type:complete len:85 (-) Transcript_33430:498-752(-)
MRLCTYNYVAFLLPESSGALTTVMTHPALSTLVNTYFHDDRAIPAAKKNMEQVNPSWMLMIIPKFSLFPPDASMRWLYALDEPV